MPDSNAAAASAKKDSAPNASRWPHLTVLACVAFLLLIGGSVLVGWHTRNEMLMTVLPGHIRMKPNTAVCFALLGLGIFAALSPGRPGRAVSALAAAATFLLGAATLFEYIAKTDLRIDQRLFQDPVQRIYPGRMAHISAAEFCVAGVCLLLLHGDRRQRRLSEALASLLTLVAVAAIVGYTYGVPVLYGDVGYTSMALHTGVAFLVLGSALLLTPSDSLLVRLISGTERGSWLARRFLLVILIVPPVLGRLYLLPAVSFGRAAFGMALFAVTIVVAGTGALMLVTDSLNRRERRLTELGRLREASAAEALRSERELRLITDQLPILLSYVDLDGRFIRVNRTYEEWLGRPAADIIGHSVEELLGTPYWNSTQPAREAMRQGRAVTFDTLYPTVSGERRTQITYAPDIDAGGVLRGFACLVLDVHERFQAERALRQTEKLAAVGRLASSIAHEMNNPLEAVTNLLYLAAHEPNGTAQIRQYMDQAQTELARVTHIVTQTLRFHRQSPTASRCRMSAIAAEVVALYHGRLTQKNITVAQRFRDATPLLCHDGEIRQVLANLVGNAVDAMDRGGTLFLRTRNIPTDAGAHTGVVVTVADTGHGIDEKTLRTLFEPFHTTKGTTGSGLGLWISKEIVERYHGRLRLRTSQRHGASGTVFQVVLTEPIDPQALPEHL